MSFPSHIFKAYDIRGIYPDELNEDMAYRIGRAFASLRQRELQKQQITCVVGHDMRLSSPALFTEMVRGLVEQGVHVVDIGLASTPVYYHAVASGGYDAGMLITASHNPKEYNGMKLTREGAKPVGAGLGMEDLRALAEQGKFENPVSPGSVEQKEGAAESFVEASLKFVQPEKIKPMKIVVDTANAMGATYLDALFKQMPHIEVVNMNYELDGTFPSHAPDPFVLENTEDLRKRVVDEKADLGIATDGDGDRIFFIDNEGEMIDPAIIRGIMAVLFLRDNPGATICYDARPGRITEDLILLSGGKPVMTKVGHSLIKQKMLEENAVFGGESSGHFFVKFDQGVYEAPMVVALKLMQEISEADVHIAHYVRPLRRYAHSGEINFRVEDKEKVLGALKEKYADADMHELDGLTCTYPTFWFNVRASNTESLLRLNLEATSPLVMEEKVKEVSELIQG